MMGRLSRVTSPLTIFTISTVLGVLTGLQAYNYVALTSEHKQPFIVLLGLNLTYWWSWALVVPGVLWMARRYRFERQHLATRGGASLPRRRGLHVRSRRDGDNGARRDRHPAHRALVRLVG